MDLEDLLFLDIETVAIVPDFVQLNPNLQKAWERKAFFMDKDKEARQLFFEKAGIYAEFGKIICIGIGYFKTRNQKLEFRVKAFSDENEENLLKEFLKIVQKFSEQSILVAHNGKEFDFPYLCRRLLVNALPLPKILQLSGKKGWQIPHLDTLEMWRFGDHKNYTSLKTLATLFGIALSEEDIDGSMINALYYGEADLEKIRNYCRHDVRMTAEVFLKIRGIQHQGLEIIEV